MWAECDASDAMTLWHPLHQTPAPTPTPSPTSTPDGRMEVNNFAQQHIVCAYTHQQPFVQIHSWFYISCTETQLLSFIP